MAERTKELSRKDGIYERILRYNCRWCNKPTDDTTISFINPDDAVDIIHHQMDQRLYEDIENNIGYALCAGAKVSKVNLNSGNYIQLEKIAKGHGFGSYVFRIYLSNCDHGFVMITDRKSVARIIRSIRDSEFFAIWKAELASKEDTLPNNMTSVVMA